MEDPTRARMARAGRWLGASLAIGLAAACTVTPGTPTKPGASGAPKALASGAPGQAPAPRALPSVPLTAQFASIFEPYTRPAALPDHWAARALRDAEMAVPGDWRLLEIESVPVQVDATAATTVDLGIPGLAPIAVPATAGGVIEPMIKWSLSIVNPARHRIQQAAREKTRARGIEPLIREDQEVAFAPEATSTADPNDEGWIAISLVMARTEGHDEAVTQFFTDWEDKLMHKRGRVLLDGVEAYYMVSTGETLGGEPAEFFKFFVQRGDELYMLAATRHRDSERGKPRNEREKRMNGEILAMLETFRWKAGPVTASAAPAPSVTPAASVAPSPVASVEPSAASSVAPSPSPSASPAAPASPSASPEASPSPSEAPSASPSPSPEASPSP